MWSQRNIAPNIVPQSAHPPDRPQALMHAHRNANTRTHACHAHTHTIHIGRPRPTFGEFHTNQLKVLTSELMCLVAVTMSGCCVGVVWVIQGTENVCHWPNVLRSIAFPGLLKLRSPIQFIRFLTAMNAILHNILIINIMPSEITYKPCCVERNYVLARNTFKTQP